MARDQAALSAAARKAWETRRRLHPERWAPTSSTTATTITLPMEERRAREAASRTAATRQALAYLRMTDEELLQLLAREQATLDKWSSHPGLAGWARQTDEGDCVSGGSLGGAIARKQQTFTAARISRLEDELDRRGFDRDVIDGWRFGEMHTVNPEREGLALDEGDTSFDIEAA